MINTRHLLMAAALVAATPAAAITFSSTNGAPDPGPGAGESILVDFNGPLPGGYTLTGDFGYQTGTVPNMYAAPAGDTTRYMYTSSAIPNGVATLSTFDLSTISFYWGSIDDYNLVEVLGVGGVTLFSWRGDQFSPANGNQTSGDTNKRVYFAAQGAERITGLRFTATGIAFEVDDVAGTLFDDGNPNPAVPEPSTWATMIIGFGAVGFARRRARRMARVAS